MVERSFPLAQRLDLARVIAALRRTDAIPSGGLAALYGPRCLPLASPSAARRARQPAVSRP